MQVVGFGLGIWVKGSETVQSTPEDDQPVPLKELSVKRGDGGVGDADGNEATGPTEFFGPTGFFGPAGARTGPVIAGRW